MHLNDEHSESRYRKLRGRIVEVYGSQAAFARQLGVAYNTMSAKMTGKTGISSEDIVLWCEMLDIRRGEIGTYFFQEVEE